MNHLALFELKKEYIIHLKNILNPIIFNKLNDIYRLSEKTKNQNMVLKKFQQELKSITEWNKKNIDEEEQNIISKTTKYPYLINLVKTIFLIYIEVLSLSTVPNEYYEDINFPTFIYNIYLECGRRFWDLPHLFYTKYQSLEIKRNQQDIIVIIDQCIENTIRKMLPMGLITSKLLGSSKSISNKLKIKSDDTKIIKKLLGVDIFDYNLVMENKNDHIKSNEIRVKENYPTYNQKLHSNKDLTVNHLNDNIQINEDPNNNEYPTYNKNLYTNKDPTVNNLNENLTYNPVTNKDPTVNNEYPTYNKNLYTNKDPTVNNLNENLTYNSVTNNKFLNENPVHSPFPNNKELNTVYNKSQEDSNKNLKENNVHLSPILDNKNLSNTNNYISPKSIINDRNTDENINQNQFNQDILKIIDNTNLSTNVSSSSTFVDKKKYSDLFNNNQNHSHNLKLNSTKKNELKKTLSTEKKNVTPKYIDVYSNSDTKSTATATIETNKRKDINDKANFFNNYLNYQ
uniref:Uncharacterized protein n=1 Tax=Megaviridae environmental sample TaxID=1737588 RepID=A0A5J6VKU3_9VIRU|nr:MAG: hypothetical protein [Megaviridae environmental sample]